MNTSFRKKCSHHFCWSGQSIFRYVVIWPVQSLPRIDGFFSSFFYPAYKYHLLYIFYCQIFGIKKAAATDQNLRKLLPLPTDPIHPYGIFYRKPSGEISAHNQCDGPVVQCRLVNLTYRYRILYTKCTHLSGYVDIEF